MTGALRRWAGWLLAAYIAMVSAFFSRAAVAVERTVLVLSIDGVINPLSARYLESGLDEGAELGVEAVVVRLNTPGGLESSMRRMTQAILSSPVPVIVHVTPPGARAASAGMFVTMAAHIAAMAPGTNIGAAHPVAVGGNEIDPVMREKMVADAAALARAIATERGRNAVWAENAVRESVSITGAEAVAQNVVDFQAADLRELLSKADGRSVVTKAGATELRTAQAAVVERGMSLPARILQTISDPNIAYVLLSVGMLGILAELSNPGLFFPGIAGVLSLILAFVALGTLPTSGAGVLLILIAVALIVADLLTSGLGVLAILGLLAFLFGSLLLFTPLTPVSPALPRVSVSPWVIGVSTAMLAASVFLLGRAVLRTRRAPIATGTEALIGKSGVALSDLAPEGTVRVDSESWTARAVGGFLQAGAPVRVIGVEGVTLRVEKADSSGIDRPGD